MGRFSGGVYKTIPLECHFPAHCRIIPDPAVHSPHSCIRATFMHAGNLRPGWPHLRQIALLHRFVCRRVRKNGLLVGKPCRVCTRKRLCGRFAAFAAQGGEVPAFRFREVATLVQWKSNGKEWDSANFFLRSTGNRKESGKKSIIRARIIKNCTGRFARCLSLP